MAAGRKGAYPSSRFILWLPQNRRTVTVRNGLNTSTREGERCVRDHSYHFGDPTCRRARASCRWTRRCVSAPSFPGASLLAQVTTENSGQCDADIDQSRASFLRGFSSRPPHPVVRAYLSEGLSVGAGEIKPWWPFAWQFRVVGRGRRWLSPKLRVSLSPSAADFLCSIAAGSRRSSSFCLWSCR